MLMPALEPQEHWDVFRACDLFTHFGSSELARILPLVRERHVPADVTITEFDERAESLFIVADGLVRVPSLVGSSSTLMMSYPDAIGVAGLVPPHRYLKTAITSTDCRMLEVPVHALRAIVEGDPSLSARLMLRVAESLTQRFFEAIYDSRGNPIGNYVA